MTRRTIRQLAEAACAKMEDIGFSEGTVAGYAKLFRRYERFAAEGGRRHLAQGLAESFVEELYADSNQRARALRACRVLEFFEATGQIPGRTALTEAVAPAAMRPYLELYIADCAGRGLSHQTVEARHRDLCQFLRFVEEHGATFPDGVDVSLVDAWAEERHEAAPRTGRHLSSVRCFLTHLFLVGITADDLGRLVPGAGRYPRKPVSKVWTDDEVRSLIGSIPTADSVGKRDKAICLLVATYGMRSGDVCALRLSDLDFSAGAIRFAQSKTGTPCGLPMTDDVAWALADWLRSGRPERASCDKVFTTMCAPYGQMSTVANVISARMEAASIRKPPGAKSGPHSLRHTVATRMVSAGAPLPVVSSVLGHTAESTTMIYLHADVDELRRCALGEGVV